MRTVGLYETPSFRFDVEHPATLVRFGAEVTQPDGSSTEYSYEYGIDAAVTKDSVAVISGGESYTLTLPPVIAGEWLVTVRTNYGVAPGAKGQARFIVKVPENSKLIDTP